MNEQEILIKFLEAKTSLDIEALVQGIREEFGDRIKTKPIGHDNNRGQIEVGTDPGKSIVERITNGIDAVLELEHNRHHGIPTCSNPREAASSWLGVPKKGLHVLSIAKRQELAKDIVVTVENGDGKHHRTVSIKDLGLGITADKISSTILSLGESNKLQKLYLAGAFGQGGSSTFANCKYSFICSRFNSESPQNNKVSFTIVFFEDLPADQYKHGHYVYLTLDNRLFEADVPLEIFNEGTLVRHYAYDLTNYGASFGPASMYGLLQRVLFDPVVPIYLEDKVHDFRRVIKGVRNALNGAIDEPEERGPAIRHSLPLFYVPIGEFGNIGIEYWVLEEVKGPKPIMAFVDNKRPILLTVNGQTHGEWSDNIIRNQLEIPFLRNRIIIHLDCNEISPIGKRNLFSSGREDTRKGEVSKLVEQELIKALDADDELKIINEEVKNLTLTKGDDETEKIIRGEIAKVLKIHGYSTTSISTAGEIGQSTSVSDEILLPIGKSHHNKISKKINIQDPPTFVNILANSPIEFYPEQRRYVRIETDAPTSYHNSEDFTKSKVNIILSGSDIKLAGSTSLKEGRMRIILDCMKTSSIGSIGDFIIEISRPGMISISNKISYKIVQRPESSPSKKSVSIPKMKFEPVNGPDDPNWELQEWPSGITMVASSSELSTELILYYSTVFPPYANAKRQFEKSNPVLATSFDTRYRIWLAVHSLLLDEDKKKSENPTGFEQWEQIERCRLATIASMIADKEVRLSMKESVQEIE